MTTEERIKELEDRVEWLECRWSSIDRSLKDLVMFVSYFKLGVEKCVEKWNIGIEEVNRYNGEVTSNIEKKKIKG
jgi:uncharacterized coiled-coil protein SlyX